MKLTDTHTHLYLDEFKDDVDQVIGQAQLRGVDHFLLPSVDRSTTQALLALADRYPEHCFPMMGLHPTSVKPDVWEAELEHVRQMHVRRRFIAVGEIGIDLYWDASNLDIQTEAFSRQLDLAHEFGLPVSLHCRNAYEELFEAIEAKPYRIKGSLHCFNGGKKEAGRAIGNGLKLGITGIVTYKNSPLPEVLADVNPKNILTETDAPYLAPVPYRGKRNESAYLFEIVQKLAEVYGRSTEEIAAITRQNSIDVFGC